MSMLSNCSIESMRMISHSDWEETELCCLQGLPNVLKVEGCGIFALHGLHGLPGFDDTMDWNFGNPGSLRRDARNSSVGSGSSSAVTTRPAVRNARTYQDKGRW